MRSAAAVLLAAVMSLSVGCGGEEQRVRTIPIDGRPSAVVVQGGLVWVADDANHVVHMVDPKTEEVVGRPIDVSKNPITMTASPGLVWVGHAGGEVVVIDAETREKVKEISAGGSITGATFLAPSVWVADGLGDTVKAIDVRSKRVVATHRIGRGAVRIAAGDDTLWVSNKSNSVTRIDVGSGEQKVFDVGGGPIGLARDDDRIWVANSDDGTVQVVGRSNAVPTGRGPVAIAVWHGSVWVANQDAATVARVERETEETLDLGTNPRGIAAGEDAIWLVGTTEEAVVRIEP